MALTLHISDDLLTKNISKLHFWIMNVFSDQGTPGNPLILCTIKMKVIQRFEVS